MTVHNRVAEPRHMSGRPWGEAKTDLPAHQLALPRPSGQIGAAGMYPHREQGQARKTMTSPTETPTQAPPPAGATDRPARMPSTICPLYPSDSAYE